MADQAPNIRGQNADNSLPGLDADTADGADLRVETEDLRLGPRAEKRYTVRVDLSERQYRLLARIRKDTDMSASGVLRASLNETGVRLYGSSALRGGPR